MNNRLIQIAQQIANLNKIKFDASVRLANLRSDESARKLFLTPLGGFPGSNTEQRKAAQESTFGSDSALKAITEAIANFQREYDGALANIDSLTDERRALEWTIRAKLVDALAGNSNTSTILEVAFQNDHEFDDSADGKIDQTAFETAEAIAADMDAAPEAKVYQFAQVDDSDLPF